MRARRFAAFVVTAGLVLAPAPAFAVAGHHSHHPGHHPAKGHHKTLTVAEHKRLVRRELRRQGKEIVAVKREMKGLHLSSKQRDKLAREFAHGVDVKGLERRLHHAHSAAQLRAVERRVRRAHELVDARVRVVRTLDVIELERHACGKLGRRLARDEGLWGSSEEEETSVVRDFDTAIIKLEGAQSILDRDIVRLVTLGSDSPEQIRREVAKVRADFGTVLVDLFKVQVALRNLERAEG